MLASLVVAPARRKPPLALFRIPSRMTDLPEAALQGLQSKLLAMPPARALQPRVEGYALGRLRLSAPLAANVNDKGTAFGGSLASLMTLAAWGLTVLQVEQAGLDGEVYVADSQLRYLAPLRDDLHAEAWLEADDGWAVFLSTLRGRGRARATLQARVLLPDGGIATTASSRYVAILRRD